MEDKFWPNKRNRELPAGCLFSPPNLKPGCQLTMDDILMTSDLPQTQRHRIEQAARAFRATHPRFGAVDLVAHESMEASDEEGQDVTGRVEAVVVEHGTPTTPTAQDAQVPASTQPDDVENDAWRFRLRVWNHSFGQNRIPMIYMRRRSRRDEQNEMRINLTMRGDGPRLLEGIIMAYNAHGDLTDIENIRRILENARRTLTLRGRTARRPRQLRL